MRGKFVRTAIAIAVSTWAAEFVLDKFVIKSDSGDPEGFIVQSEGFGLDDIVRLVSYGAIGAFAVGLMSKGKVMA